MEQEKEPRIVLEPNSFLCTVFTGTWQTTNADNNQRLSVRTHGHHPGRRTVSPAVSPAQQSAPPGRYRFPFDENTTRNKSKLSQQAWPRLPQLPALNNAFFFLSNKTIKRNAA